MSLLITPQTGRWTDQSNHHRTQWLQSDSKAQWYKVAVAICLTLSSPYVLRILQRSFSGLRYLIERRKISPTGADDEENRQQVPGDGVTTAESGRQAWSNFLTTILNGGAGVETRHHIFSIFVLASICFVFYGQIIFGSLLTDIMTTDSLGLLQSKNCGLYEFDNEEWGDEEASRADNLMVERESRAAAYASECYDGKADTKGKAMRCDFFYRPNILYDVTKASCPFTNQTVCVERSQPESAVTFDTGFQDSSLFGINGRPTYKVRRNTTCAALSAERPYVVHFNNDLNDHGYLYNYGSIRDTTKSCEHPNPISDFTMRIVGHPFDWQAPMYRLNTWATSLQGDQSCDTYQPIAALQAPGLTSSNTTNRTRTLTIVFVAAMHIVYTQKSNDPIFRAPDEFRYPGDTRPYYKNGSPKSRAFACVDETTFCDPSGKHCWHEYDSIPKDVSHIADDPTYWFMVYAMKKSNTYDSIKLRLGSSLLAQQMVGSSRSKPLPDYQWEIEAEHMYRTSLARAQFDAWSLGSGEDAGKVPSYKNSVPEMAGNMCGRFKAHFTGYVNIQIWPFFILCAVLPFTFFMSVEITTYTQMWSRLKNKLSQEPQHTLGDATQPLLPVNSGDDGADRSDTPNHRTKSGDATANDNRADDDATANHNRDNDHGSEQGHFTIGSNSSRSASPVAADPAPPIALIALVNVNNPSSHIQRDTPQLPPAANLPHQVTNLDTPSAAPSQQGLQTPTAPSNAPDLTTRLNPPAQPDQAPRNYGSIATSVRSGRGSIRSARPVSGLRNQVEEVGEDGQAAVAGNQRTEYFEPLLIHLPFVVIGWIWRRVRGVKAGRTA